MGGCESTVQHAKDSCVKWRGSEETESPKRVSTMTPVEENWEGGMLPVTSYNVAEKTGMTPEEQRLPAVPSSPDPALTLPEPSSGSLPRPPPRVEFSAEPFKLLRSYFKLEGEEPTEMNFSEDQKIEENSNGWRDLLTVITPGKEAKERIVFKVGQPIKGLKMITHIIHEQEEVSTAVEELGDFKPSPDEVSREFKYPAVSPQQLCVRYTVRTEFKDENDRVLFEFFYLLAGPLTLHEVITYRENSPVPKTISRTQESGDEEELVLKCGTMTSSKVSFFVNKDVHRLQMEDKVFLAQFPVDTTTIPMETVYKARDEPYEFKCPDQLVPSEFTLRGRYTGITRFISNGVTLMEYTYKYAIKKNY